MNNCYVNVCGGIGNQLFQIANGYAYSKIHNKNLIIDPLHWTSSQGKSPKIYETTIFKNFTYGSIFTEDVDPISEKDFNYSELEFKGGNVSLNGYFQSLKYFQECKDEFINLLNLPKVNSSFIQSKNIAFHIRRGDYAKFPNIFGNITPYFHRMFKRFENEFQINVFTDSPNYVLQEFEKYNFNLIQTSSELNDLTLLSKHDNIVGSNSSFSWWGSLLGKRKEYIIFPDRWLLDKDCIDIYYDGIIKEKYEL
jgi:hypothetical protein